MAEKETFLGRILSVFGGNFEKNPEPDTLTEEELFRLTGRSAASMPPNMTIDEIRRLAEFDTDVRPLDRISMPPEISEPDTTDHPPSRSGDTLRDPDPRTLRSAHPRMGIVDADGQHLNDGKHWDEIAPGNNRALTYSAPSIPPEKYTEAVDAPSVFEKEDTPEKNPDTEVTDTWQERIKAEASETTDINPNVNER